MYLKRKSRFLHCCFQPPGGPPGAVRVPYDAEVIQSCDVKRKIIIPSATFHSHLFTDLIKTDLVQMHMAAIMGLVLPVFMS